MFFDLFKTFQNIFHQQNYEWHCQEIEDKWLFIFKHSSTTNMHIYVIKSC